MNESILVESPVKDHIEPPIESKIESKIESRISSKKTVNQNKLNKRLRREVGRAIHDYSMIVEGDRVMVCMSGGKDSYTMLDILMSLQHSAPVQFDIVAVNLDQKQPGFPEHILPNYFESLGIEYHIINEDTYSTVTRVIPTGKTMCSLCSRLRRGILYKTASALNCTKVALGHHRDDILETLFLNMFHGGKLKSMPAKLRSDDGRHVLIRPLAYCREADIAKYAELKEFPIIPCNLCGSQTNLQRVVIKKMLQDWEVSHPGRVDSIFTAVQNIAPSHMLDRTLFDFTALDAPREPLETGEQTKVQKQLTQRIPVVNHWFGLTEQIDKVAQE